MTVQTWTFANAQTGLFSSRMFTGAAAGLAANTPAGYVAVAGRHNGQAVRLDVVTAQVVPYQPPAPADDALTTWAWDVGRWRWIASPTFAALRDARVLEVQRAIELAEGQQARPLREVSLALSANEAPPAAALAKLAEVQAEIDALRVVRSAMAAAQDATALAAIVWP